MEFKTEASVVVEMGFEDLFVRFWWLIFPLMGLVVAFMEMVHSGRRSKQAMDVIKSYVEQGKDPPAELLDIAAGGSYQTSNQPQSAGFLFLVFTVTVIGFGFAFSSFVPAKSQDYVALIAVFWVVALVFYLITMFGPRPQK